MSRLSSSLTTVVSGPVSVFRFQGSKGPGRDRGVIGEFHCRTTARWKWHDFWLESNRLGSSRALEDNAVRLMTGEWRRMTSIDCCVCTCSQDFKANSFLQRLPTPHSNAAVAITLRPVSAPSSAPSILPTVLRQRLPALMRMLKLPYSIQSCSVDSSL